MVTAYATNVQYPTGTQFIASTHYKAWDDKNNLLGNSGYAICNRTVSPIATASGTYNRPAPLELTGFGFQIPQGADIEKVIVHYSHKKITLSSSTAYPTFAGPVITLLNTGQSKTGKAVPTTYTANTLEFTGVTAQQINSNSFGVKIAYPKNTSSNPGRLALGNVYIEVIYSAPQIAISGLVNKTSVLNTDTVKVTVNLEKLNNVAYSPKVNIEFKNTLTYVGNVTGKGSLTKISNTKYEWNSEMSTSTSKNTVSFDLRATTVGQESIVLTDTQSGKSYTIQFKVIDFTDTVTSSISQSGYTKNETNYYNILFKTNEPGTCNRTMKILLPTCTTLDTDNITYLQNNFNAQFSTTTTNFIIQLSITASGTKTIYLRPIFSQSGYYTQEVQVNNKTFIVSDFIVRSEGLGNLAFTRLEVPEDVLETMTNGYNYTFSSIIKSTQNQIHDVTDNLENLRIGVYNSSSQYLNNEQNFISRVVWSNPKASTNWTLHKVNFSYDNTNPLYLVVSHEFVGDLNYPITVLDFTNPVLIETEYFEDVEDDKKMLIPPNALLGNTEFATVTLQQSEETVPVLCYEWDDGGIFELDNFRLQGIQCCVDYTTSENVQLMVKLSLNDGKIVGYRNITLFAGEGTAEIGTKFDLFGLNPSDFKEISRMELQLIATNPYPNAVQLEINNLQLKLNYLLIEALGYGFEVDGERSEDYGIILEDLEHHFGAEHKSSEYTVPGMDKVLYSRLNIDKKEITIEISVDSCDLKETMPLIDKIVNKLTNKREPLSNRPIPKSIIFDHLDDRRFWYIIEDSFDDEVEAGIYTAKIKLIIPDGTAEAVAETISGSVGQTNGLISIHPKITLINTVNNQLIISEEQQGLTFSCYDERIESGDTIHIDNENRTIMLQKQGSSTSVDLKDSVDFMSDWIFIEGKYEFTSPTSAIVNVAYYERLS